MGLEPKGCISKPFCLVYGILNHGLKQWFLGAIVAIECLALNYVVFTIVWPIEVVVKKPRKAVQNEPFRPFLPFIL